MSFVVLAAWLVGVGVNFYYGNRWLPLVIFLVGGVLTFVHFTSGLGFVYIGVMALLAVIIWISNKLEML